MKSLHIVTFFLLLPLFVSAQGSSVRDKITLNTGEVYYGSITLKNNEVVIIKTDDGTNYQFQTTEIKLIETGIKVTLAKKNGSQTVENEIAEKDNFCAMIELAAGTTKAENCFNANPNAQVSLLFGKKEVLGKKIFLGLGAGYNNIITSESTISFIPVFARIQSTLSKNRTAPFVGMDAGYSFATNSGYGGGALVKINVGITHKISYKSVLFAGIHAGVQSISGTLTEMFESKPYIHYGHTSMTSIGINIGMRF